MTREENCSFAVATGMVEHECIVFTRLKKECADLKAFIEKAFIAHPNLDLDIKALDRTNK